MSNSVVEIVRAEYAHALDIAPRLRLEDVEELQAGTGVTPITGLRKSLMRSEYSMTALINGRPEVMFGVGHLSILPVVGSPWLLGTDEIDRHPRQFLTLSREWLDAMLQKYQLLRNVVDDRHESSKRWLAHLGFQMSEPIIMGKQRRPFRLFEIGSPYV